MFIYISVFFGCNEAKSSSFISSIDPSPILDKTVVAAAVAASSSAGTDSTPNDAGFSSVVAGLPSTLSDFCPLAFKPLDTD